MSQQTAGYGVVVHNGDFQVTYFLKVDGVAQATLKGQMSAEGFEAKAKGYSLAMKRTLSTNPKAPMVKGVLTIGKKKINVAGFLHEDHTVGISEDTGAVTKEQWAWPTA